MTPGVRTHLVALRLTPIAMIVATLLVSYSITEKMILSVFLCLRDRNPVDPLRRQNRPGIMYRHLPHLHMRRLYLHRRSLSPLLLMDRLHRQLCSMDAQDKGMKTLVITSFPSS